MEMNANFLQNEEIRLVLKRTSNAVPEKEWLPACYYDICLLDETVVGSIDLRIGHNDRVYYGGNIGYEIKPEHRGHHYAGKAVKLLLKLAKQHQMEWLIITCDPANAASAKSCEYAGGTLETIADLPPDHDLYKAGKRKACIYRFDLKQI